MYSVLLRHIFNLITYVFEAADYQSGLTFAEARNFRCESCGRSYKYKRGLMAHKRYYCGKEPQFSCPRCSKRFVEPKSLTGHLALVHKIVISKSLKSANKKNVPVSCT